MPASPTPTSPSRRILSVWLARLSVDRWQRAHAPDAPETTAPTALIADTAHGPRITAANDAGLAAGARAGMLLADARALCPELTAVPGDPAGDLASLEKLALWAQRWGPWSALDPPDGLLIDVTGVAHLYGGEEALLGDVARAFTQRGLTARAALAPTAGAAWALAHFGSHPARPGAILAPGDDPLRMLGDLPVAALRLDDDVLTVLRRLGIKRLGELAGVSGAGDDPAAEAAARDSLRRRFRNHRSPAANPLLRLDQLLGRVPEPLLPVIAQMMPMVQRRLMEPLRHRDLLDRVVEDLAADMVRTLEARGEGARRLELALWRVDGEVLQRRIELAAATREASHITRLFAARLDDVEAGFGIEAVQLRASWSEPLEVAQADLDAAAEHHGTALAACIDRLTVRLGAKAVTRPVLRASHIPERAQGWQLPMEPLPPAQGALAFHARPLKLLDRAEPIAVLYASPDGVPQRFRWRGSVREVVRVEGPERIAPEWWRERSTTRLRDYYRVEDEAGRRYWIYRQGIAGDGRGGMPDWFLQGLCA
ncbi:MAG: DNA polymerase Y family protein [Sphingomonadales bacterium]|nr:DNA polymerase Y family protein [Sphingomonadales bacterium]NCQ21464.1 DNA polymerase Y family protein [Sphingomonadales bacterium]NCT04251.1 DNA polymerase Y family protein [Sphingomonadales bacterium]